MAVPLGSPQTKAGVTVCTSFVTSPSLTTSPKHQPKASPPSNVAVVTVMNEEEEPVEKKPTLVKQVEYTHSSEFKSMRGHLVITSKDLFKGLAPRFIIYSL